MLLRRRIEIHAVILLQYSCASQKFTVKACSSPECLETVGLEVGLLEIEDESADDT